MPLHPIIGSLPQRGHAKANPSTHGTGPSVSFFDRASDSFTDFLTLYLPEGTPLVNVEVIAGAINAALAAAPPETETETEVVF